MMKAIIYKKYGSPDVLELAKVDKPSPGKKELLIKVHATTVTAADWRMRKADPFAARLYNGLFRPKKVNILGLELAGVVEATGGDVTKFKVGDSVFAFTGFGFGGYAEYKCMKEEGSPTRHGLIAVKPDNVSFEEAAAVPCGGLTALALLRKAKVPANNDHSVEPKNLLVYGASGSVGTYAVQLARYFGAEVTAVCSTRNVELVSSLGVNNVIDYTNVDIRTIGETFDVVFDAVGKLPASVAKRLLRKNGRYVSVRSSAKILPDDLNFLAKLMGEGMLKAVIDRRYPLEDVADAHRYVETWRKKGNVVVTL